MDETRPCINVQIHLHIITSFYQFYLNKKNSEKKNWRNDISILIRTFDSSFNGKKLCWYDLVAIAKVYKNWYFFYYHELTLTKC